MRSLAPYAATALLWAVLPGPAAAGPSPSQAVEQCRRHADFADRGGVAFDALDPERAVPACERASRMRPRDGRIVALLARAIRKTDEAKAEKLARKSARMGDATGMIILGTILGGRGDLAGQFSLFGKAARAGDALAMFNLAANYENGHGTARDDIAARDWFAKSARAGYREALISLGRQHEVGTVGAVDLAKAADFYRRAGEEGLGSGWHRLGTMAEQGLGRPVDEAEARRLYELAGRNGSVEGKTALARLAFTGRGGPEDKETAYRLFLQAGHAGDATALGWLGAIHFEGNAKPRDLALAERYLSRAEALGNLHAEGNLGMMNLMYFPERSRVDALAALARSAAVHRAHAEFLSSVYDQAEYGVPRDLAEARRWLLAAVAIQPQASVDVQVLLAIDTRAGTVPATVAAIRSRSSGLPQAYEAFYLIRLGLYDFVTERLAGLTGEDGKPFLEAAEHDVVQTRASYRHAPTGQMLDRMAELGSGEASYLLALKEADKGGLAASNEAMVSRLRSSVATGHAEARLMLAFLGLGGPPTAGDVVSVRDGPSDYPETAVLLAWAYGEGRGVEADPSRTRSNLLTLGNAREPELVLWAARRFEEGIGVPAEPDEAVRLYRRATGLGNAEAAGRLARALARRGESASGEARATADRIAELERGEAEAVRAGEWDKAISRRTGVADLQERSGLFGEAVASHLKSLAWSREKVDTERAVDENYFGLVHLSCRWGTASHHAYAFGERDAALFLAKGSVNLLQQARKLLGTIPAEMRECFLKVHQDRYRWLADLFVSQGRLAEAEQVLRMLEDFTYSEYVSGDETVRSSRDDRMPMSDTERRAEAAVTSGARTIAALTRRVTELEAKGSALTAPETAELREAEKRLVAADAAFNHELAGIARQWKPTCGADEKNCSAERSASLDEAQYDEARESLEKLRETGGAPAAYVFTFVLPDRTTALLVTESARLTARWDVTDVDLGNKVRRFREAIEKGEDVRELGREFHARLIAPFSDELKATGVRTIAFSMDRALSYLPVGAIHDGGAYLAESYALAARTPGTLKPRPADLRVAAFGVSEAHPGFAPLRSVPAELAGIVKEKDDEPGVMAGERRLDAAFTRASLAEAMGKRYPILHVATHFDLGNADENGSRLLLGDGSFMSMQDLRTSLRGATGRSRADLLVLSACNTGVPLRADEGTPLRSAARTLQSWSGVGTVVGTLWPVPDLSTAAFMKQFYALLRDEPSLGRAEALARVQGDFIAGRIERPKTSRSATQTPWTHPRFWAPFVMIGNWL